MFKISKLSSLFSLITSAPWLLYNRNDYNVTNAYLLRYFKNSFFRFCLMDVDLIGVIYLLRFNIMLMYENYIQSQSNYLSIKWWWFDHFFFGIVKYKNVKILNTSNSKLLIFSIFVELKLILISTIFWIRVCKFFLVVP